MAMNFGQALEFLKQGKRVARMGWHGEGMYLYLVKGSEFEVNREPLASVVGMGTYVLYRPHIDLYSDGTYGCWVASQTDLLSEDWVAA